MIDNNNHHHRHLLFHHPYQQHESKKIFPTRLKPETEARVFAITESQWQCFGNHDEILLQRAHWSIFCVCVLMIQNF